jgi:hypothetical protein
MNLPRLLYVGPAIEPSFGGSALLYKLLQDYPRERLVSVEMQLSGMVKLKNTFGCRSILIARPPARLGPRAHTLFDLTLLYGRHVWANWLNWRLQDYRFEAVVGVTHGWLCEVGLLLAHKRKVPFHAIIHDHAQNTLPAPRGLSHYRQRRWERLCRLADSRLCVSPYMAEAVNKIGGLPSVVLYPGLAPGTELKVWSPPARSNGAANLTFGFIGTVHPGYREMILSFGEVLQAAGHRLMLHSPGAAELATLQPRGLVNGGWIPTEAVAKTLQQETDALFLPMSFHESDAPNMRVSFPSKIVEYCAAGRPVLIWGPHYCSAVRWAKEHPGFAEVVETNVEQDVLAAVRRLEDAAVREKAGRKSLELANTYFSHENTFGVFSKVLSQKSFNH